MTIMEENPPRSILIRSLSSLTSAFFFYYCYFLPLTVLNDYLIDLSV